MKKMQLASLLIFLIISCFLASHEICWGHEYAPSSLPFKNHPASSPLIPRHDSSFLRGLNESTDGATGETQQEFSTKPLEKKMVKPTAGRGYNLLRRPRPPAHSGSPTTVASNALVQLSSALLIGFIFFYI